MEPPLYHQESYHPSESLMNGGDNGREIVKGASRLERASSDNCSSRGLGISAEDLLAQLRRFLRGVTVG